MDRAIWAVLYDLPETDREIYLHWFHEVHIPELLSRPGILWAAHYETAHPGERFQKILERLRSLDDPALASGKDFIALFGAETTRTFHDPTLSQIAERQNPQARQMLARRIRPLSLVLCEEWRVDGPEADKRALGHLAPVIQMGRYDTQGNDEDLEAWYAKERLIGIERTPGCIGARKLLVAAGSPKHAVLYEFVSLEARDAHYVDLEDTEWTHRVHDYLLHPPGSPLVGKRIWPLP